LRYQVRVRFNKEFIDVDERQKIIAIGVNVKPVKGRANEEVIKKLAQHFGVSSANVSIIAGARSKDKIIEIV
jgi:uncharacterized protein